MFELTNLSAEWEGAVPLFSCETRVSVPAGCCCGGHCGPDDGHCGHGRPGLVTQLNFYCELFVKKMTSMKMYALNVEMYAPGR